jgi:hypothetical protein
MKQVYYKIYFLFFIKIFYLEMYKKIPERISTKLYNEILEKLPIGGDRIHGQVRSQIEFKLNKTHEVSE